MMNNNKKWMKSNENYENDEKRLRIMKNNENDGELMQNWRRTGKELIILGANVLLGRVLLICGATFNS